MTIKIINNSNSGHNIYPVLTTGTAVQDKWLQAWFEVPKSELDKRPYPKLNAFRIYINPGEKKNGEWRGDGIAPGKSVTIKIPLLSQLVQDPNPKQTDQYADWWGGGRVEIFDAPAANHAPPAALIAAYTGANRADQKELCKQLADKCPIAGTPVPECIKGCDEPLTFFRDNAQFKNNEPILLTEYTLGAINQSKDPFELNDHNVDYDVSYVDTAYLPAVMVPWDNPQVGYVGSPLPIADFTAALGRFVKDYPGWPQFIDNQGNTILKLPSVLHVFGSDDPDLTPPPWKPIKKLIAQWHDCLPDSETSALCTKTRSIREMFQANYDNYVANYAELGCNTQEKPVELNEKLMIGHVYGWGPFNEHCPAEKNLLENTPGYKKNHHAPYQRIKDKFDDLHYMKNGKFNPYVVLIHGEKYVNAPNVYAYSVDDAVGNMQVDATGFMIEVGGTEGLPNPNPATPPIHISLGYSRKDAVRFTEYGVCTDPPNKKIDPDFPSFNISITSIGACPLTLLDNAQRHYIFEVTQEPPYVQFHGEDAHWTKESSKVIDCSSNTDKEAAKWCRDEESSSGIYAYSQQQIGGRGKLDNFVITKPAVQN